MSDEEKEYIDKYVHKEENLDTPLGTLAEHVQEQYPHLDKDLIINEMVISLIGYYDE